MKVNPMKVILFFRQTGKNYEIRSTTDSLNVDSDYKFSLHTVRTRLIIGIKYLSMGYQWLSMSNVLSNEHVHWMGSNVFDWVSITIQLQPA